VEVSAVLQLIKDSQVFVQFSAPYAPAHSNQKLEKIWVSFDHIPSVVKNETLFADLVADLLLKPSATITLKGIANAIASTAMGNITLSDIHFGQVIVIPGMSGFSGTPIKVVNQVISGTAPNILLVELVLAVTNPTYLKFTAPFLPVDLLYENVLIGNSTISPYIIKANTTNNGMGHSMMIKDGTNNELIDNLLSMYVAGIPVNMTIKGAPDKTNINVMKKALSKFQAVVTTPGEKINFIQYFQIEITFDIFFGDLPTKMTLTNPWNLDVKIVNIYQDVFLEGKKIAHLYEDITSNPILIPANQTIITDYQPVKLDGITPEEFEGLFENIHLSVKGTMTTLVGNQFQTALNYSQDGIPCSIWKN